MEVVIEIQFQDGEMFTIKYDDTNKASEQAADIQFAAQLTGRVHEIKTVRMVFDGEFEIFNDEEDCARRIAAFSNKWRN